MASIRIMKQTVICMQVSYNSPLVYHQSTCNNNNNNNNNNNSNNNDNKLLFIFNMPPLHIYK